MVFNSYTFIIFFIVVFSIHNLPINWKIKKLSLLLFSYLFYAAWNPPFVALLMISTLADWFIAQWLGKETAKHNRWLLIIGTLTVNLGLLGFFKYGTFLVDNFVWVIGLLGISYNPVRPDIVLPVGISFYTFQTLSYTLDVYFRKTRPCQSFLDFALYVTFFPQLVAGPIVRSTDFLPQCVEPRKATSRQLAWGFMLFIIGIFEKVVVADSMAPVVEKVFDSTAQPAFMDAWSSAFAFSCQIFCDFAGYSTCAIGAAMCLGFALPDNFRFPYAAIGFSDFWRRWHISLSTWLRDYLYIPLGGNRKGKVREKINIMITMLLGGLWHGASWTFVTWGALHGLFLVIERILKQRIPDYAIWHKYPFQLFFAMLTFLLTCIVWVFFRSPSFERAFTIILAMFGATRHQSFQILEGYHVFQSFVITLFVLVLHWMMRDTSVESVLAKWPWWLKSVFLSVLCFAIATTTGEDRAFIYFQF